MSIIPWTHAKSLKPSKKSIEVHGNTKRSKY